MSVNEPKYPNWDGTSPTRDSRLINRPPDAEDWDQIIAETLAQQEAVASSDLTGVTSIDGVEAPNSDGGDLSIRAGDAQGPQDQVDGGTLTAFAGNANGTTEFGTGGDYLVGAGGGNIPGNARMSGGSGGGFSEVVGGAQAIATGGPGRVKGGDGLTGGDAEIDSGAGLIFGGDVNVGATEARRVNIGHATVELGFHGATAVAQQTITGSRASGAALTDLLTKLATLGIIIDGTSA